MTKDDILKAILEMAQWDDMHEELKIEEVTPMSKVEEYVFKLNKEMEATIVTHKEKKRSWKIMCPRCYLSISIGSQEWMEEGITNQSLVSRVKLGSTKIEQLLVRQPKCNFLFLSFISIFLVFLSILV